MKILMITGAGISTSSGINTYRGADGRYTAIEQQAGMPIQELLSTEGLERHPELVWKYWLEFSLSLKQARPSPSHHAIVRIARQCDEFLEVTQNVDGLSLKAGLPSEQLIELHGTARHYRCAHCNAEHGLTIVEGMAIPPRCYRCNGEEGRIIRPSVVLFNELIDSKSFDRITEFASRADYVIVVGTSLQFYYLHVFLRDAISAGAKVIKVDPAEEIDLGFVLHPDTGRPLTESIEFIRRTSDEYLCDLAMDLHDF